MNIAPHPQTTAPATLQHVLDRLAGNGSLSPTRKRDLCSAIACVARLMGQPPAATLLDLADIRRALDRMVPARAQISPKRWANLRSDLANAIDASGLRRMLKTAGLDLNDDWSQLLAPADHRIRHGLSRLGRWASLHGIRPVDVDATTIDRFMAQLGEATLIRNLWQLRGSVTKAWNALVALDPAAGLKPVAVSSNRAAPTRLPWNQFPLPFREDVERYLNWAAVPDPLAEGARARALSPLSLRLQRTHIHSAASAAIAAGLPIDQLASLANLIEPETFRTLLRHLWQKDGCRLSAYTHGVAITLIDVARNWVKTPAETIATLKALRNKIGTLPSGLTEKNRATLRQFEDPRLLAGLIQLPDKLWHSARRNLATSPRAFVNLQTALAIDLLTHVPLRMRNLTALTFDQHLHWPQGRRKPALITFQNDETKNDILLNYEIPASLADRLWLYRNEIAPAVIGERPSAVFVSLTGKPKTQGGLKLAIEKAVRRYLGVKVTPHQYRHLAAKLALDNNPGAYELVRQLLGHKNLKTTTNFYSGVDTRRAGRAHADLIMKLRESKLNRRGKLQTLQPRDD